MVTDGCSDLCLHDWDGDWSDDQESMQCAGVWLGTLSAVCVAWSCFLGSRKLLIKGSDWMEVIKTSPMGHIRWSWRLGHNLFSHVEEAKQNLCRMRGWTVIIRRGAVRTECYSKRASLNWVTLKKPCPKSVWSVSALKTNHLPWEDHGQSQFRQGGTTQEGFQERTSPSLFRQDVLLRPESEHLWQVARDSIQTSTNGISAPQNSHK